MKANELMIGDLVKTSNNANWSEDLRGLVCRVTNLGNQYIASDSIDNPDRKPYGSSTSFEPIPITIEILEKNEFTQCEPQGYDLYQRNKEEAGLYRIFWQGEAYNYYLEISAYTYPFGEFSKTNIKYVHQLQHALKLCGIEKTIEL